MESRLANRGVRRSVAREALDMLCTAYWYPIYALIRRKGKDPHKAFDLSRGIRRLLEKGALARWIRERGGFAPSS